MKSIKFIACLLLLSCLIIPSISAAEQDKSENNSYILNADIPWSQSQIGTVYGLNIGLPVSGKADVVKGADFSLSWSTVKKVDGLQLAIFGDHDVNTVNGVQIASIWNYVNKDVYGLQASLFYNEIARDMVGVQLGCVNNAQRNCKGLQISSVNTVNETLWGVQISCLNWATKYCKGVQIGGLNVTKKLKGIQIGLINTAEHSRGLQIGLFNHIKDSRVPFMPIINF